MLIFFFLGIFPWLKSAAKQANNMARKVRNKLHVLESQTYISQDVDFLGYLERELDRLSSEFHKTLPADAASGLIVPPGIDMTK